MLKLITVHTKTEVRKSMMFPDKEITYIYCLVDNTLGEKVDEIIVQYLDGRKVIYNRVREELK